MSNNDNIVINQFERATSADINDLQSLAARWINDALGVVSLSDYDTASSHTPLSRPASFSGVLGGLDISGTGAVIIVGAGVMVQTSSIIPNASGVLGSEVRISRNAGNYGAACPTPATGTWYWLRAQATVNNTSSLQDIYSNGSFTPTNVVSMQEIGIDFSFQAGTATTLPTVTDMGSWVYLAAVFCDPTGAVTTVDVRNILSPGFKPGGSGVIAKNDIRPSGANTIALNTSLNTRFGVLNPGVFAANTASYVSPGTTIAPNGLYHVYVCVPQIGGFDFVPWRAAARQRGIVCISSTAPTLEGIASAPIALPSYTSNALNFGTAPAANCFYVGTLHRGTSDWSSSAVLNRTCLFRTGGFGAAVPNQPLSPSNITPGTGGSATGNLTIDLATVPPNAKSVKVQVRVYLTGVNSASGFAFATFGGAVPFYQSSTSCGVDSITMMTFDWPIASLGNVIGATITMAPTYTAGQIFCSSIVLGWEF